MLRGFKFVNRVLSRSRRIVTGFYIGTTVVLFGAGEFPLPLGRGGGSLGLHRIAKTSDRHLRGMHDLRCLCGARVPRARHVQHAADHRPIALAETRMVQPASDPVLAHRSKYLSTHALPLLDHLSARPPPLPLAHLRPRRVTRCTRYRRPALVDVAATPRACVRAVSPRPYDV